jgi:hypothetical protein
MPIRALGVEEASAFIAALGYVKGAGPSSKVRVATFLVISILLSAVLAIPLIRRVDGLPPLMESYPQALMELPLAGSKDPSLWEWTPGSITIWSLLTANLAILTIYMILTYKVFANLVKYVKNRKYGDILLLLLLFVAPISFSIFTDYIVLPCASSVVASSLALAIAVIESWRFGWSLSLIAKDIYLFGTEGIAVAFENATHIWNDIKALNIVDVVYHAIISPYQYLFMLITEENLEVSVAYQTEAIFAVIATFRALFSGTFILSWLVVKPTHRLLSLALLRFAESEKGPLTTIAAGLAILAKLIEVIFKSIHR